MVADGRVVLRESLGSGNPGKGVGSRVSDLRIRV